MPVSAPRIRPRRAPSGRYSVQVEQQYLRRPCRREFDLSLVCERCCVTAAKSLAVQLHFAFGYVEPHVALWRDRVRHTLVWTQLGQPEVRILVNGDRAVT